MGTRSFIALEDTSIGGSSIFRGIYCHYDGYLSHNGKILQEHYTTIEKVKQLIDLGNLSILGKDIGYKHRFDEKVEGSCKAYGRDRGEQNTTAQTATSLKHIYAKANYMGCEYFYLFKNGQWFVRKVTGGMETISVVMHELKIAL